MSTPDLVQVRNPRTGGYTVVDRAAGAIIDHVAAPCTGVPIVGDERPVSAPLVWPVVIRNTSGKQLRTLYVALRDQTGAVVASCEIGNTEAHPGAPFRWANLTNVYVAPSARGRGEGRRLVRAAIDAARADGIHRLSLFVVMNEPISTRLRSLYRSCGFREAWGDGEGVGMVCDVLPLPDELLPVTTPHNVDGPADGEVP